MSGSVIGEDECGTWFGCTKGDPVRLPNGDERPMEYSGLVCLPHDDWFAMHYWHAHPEVELYVDISTPVVRTADAVTVIDLDFDVIRWNRAMGGHVSLVDEDEFEQHRVELSYPDDLQAAARRAAQDVLARVTRREKPFNLETVAPWLDALLTPRR
jgi:protein associated with RNAse G/E